MDVWATLRAAGLPEGAARPSDEVFDYRAVREAVDHIADGRESISPDRREPLLAWLSAWRSHWRTSFDEILGASGTALAERIASEPFDENRYLKLRRIAIANLATLI